MSIACSLCNGAVLLGRRRDGVLYGRVDKWLVPLAIVLGLYLRERGRVVQKVVGKEDVKASRTIENRREGSDKGLRR